MRDEEPSVYVTEESFEYGGVAQTVAGVSSLRFGWRSMTEGSSFRMNRRGVRGWKTGVSMMRATRSALSPLLVVFQDDIRHSVGAE